MPLGAGMLTGQIKSIDYLPPGPCPRIFSVIPIAGARSETRIKENSISVDLSKEDLTAITAILNSFPVIGNRYPAAPMKLVEFYRRLRGEKPWPLSIPPIFRPHEILNFLR
ncbi:hypothetical protein F4781DRAFT_438311 [Annulohypoxylon bovei var. microspora]|nr:hypothetical protein F4781DRAFT_438311 [Annulohypoxylon bovei var. microspora]